MDDHSFDEIEPAMEAEAAVYKERPGGYRSPPIHSRFKPGQSGNPKGRPKQSNQQDDVLRRIAGRPCKISTGGKRKCVSNLEAIIRIIRHKAISGEKTASDFVNRMIGVDETAEHYVPKGVIILPEELTQEEWIAEFGVVGASE